MKSTHDEITDLLHGYLHGTLTEEKAATVEAHLSDCDECAEEFSVAATLLKIEAPEPDDQYFNTLTSVVINTARATVPNRFNLWRYLFRPIPVTAAFASLCLVIYLVAVNFGGFHSGQVQYGNKTAKNIMVDTSVSDDIMNSLEEEYGDDFSVGYEGGDDVAVAL
ncbi:anti-sigma factor family protein [Candidatus Magnetominusculus dajiuhuensis]|uniref:anti-sigma factor family protein n=1 Tax=Candidatus Magnetominusculus dajiuhuensis TaxID=3137712 RepID=UPI003B42D8B6